MFEGEPDTQENEGEAGDDDEDEEDEEEEQEGGDENENDFEAAWEALETARLIYSKMPESRMELANVYLALGDLSLEEEKFDQASNDYRDALVIKKGLLKNDNRELAEMHYKLALALEYKGDCEGALMEMESAMEILRWRLAALKDQSEAVAAGGAVVSPGPNPGKGKGKAMEKQMSAEEIEEERSDLEMLLPDIKLKIEELRSSLKPAAEGEVAEGATVTAVPAQVPVAAAVAAVNDLSMLVKKKAKPVEDANVMKRKMEEPAEAVADKKAKSDESN